LLIFYWLHCVGENISLVFASSVIITPLLTLHYLDMPDVVSVIIIIIIIKSERNDNIIF